MGFPYPEDANDKITAIAIHNSEEDDYYCLVLDDKKKLTLQSKDNVIIESFDNEFGFTAKILFKIFRLETNNNNWLEL